MGAILDLIPGQQVFVQADLFGFRFCGQRVEEIL